MTDELKLHHHNTEEFELTPLQRKILEYAAKQPQPRGYFVTKTGTIGLIFDEPEQEKGDR